MAASKRAARERADATFHDHLKELRTRAFAVVLIFLVGASLVYSYKDPILSLLMRPLDGEQLIYLTPGGGFAFIFQVSLYVGLIVATPVLMFSVFRFLAPVLVKKTKMLSVIVMLASLLLLVAGASFGYLFAIPAAMDFLSHFADGFASASLTAQSYLSFVMAYTAGLGLLFQLPLILLFVHWIFPLKPRKLMSFQRYVILFAFVIAALISPTPDAVNQTIIAVPIIVMYQLGVIAIWVSVLRRNKKVRAQARKARAATVRTGKEVTVTPPAAVKSAKTPRPVAKPRPPVAVATPKIAPPAPAPVAMPAAATAKRRYSVDGLPIARPAVRPPSVAASIVVPPRTVHTAAERQKVAAHPRPQARSIDGVSIVATNA